MQTPGWPLSKEPLSQDLTSKQARGENKPHPFIPVIFLCPSCPPPPQCFWGERTQLQAMHQTGDSGTPPKVQQRGQGRRRWLRSPHGLCGIRWLGGWARVPNLWALLKPPFLTVAAISSVAVQMTKRAWLRGSDPGRARQLILALLRAPFEGFFLQGVGFDLVAHPTQEVGGGLGGHDQRLDHGGRDLPQDAAHGPRDALLLVPTSSHVADGLGRVYDALRGDGKEGLEAATDKRLPTT